MGEPREVSVLDSGPSCPELMIVEGGGYARAVVRPSMGAEHRSLNRIRLDAAARTVALSHPMEAVYYVMAGSGAVAAPAGRDEQSLREGSMIHIEAGTGYRFIAGADGMEILGGPCPFDPKLYR